MVQDRLCVNTVLLLERREKREGRWIESTESKYKQERRQGGGGGGLWDQASEMKRSRRNELGGCSVKAYGGHAGTAESGQHC